MAVMMSRADLPSTVAPTDPHVPRISLTVPTNCLAILLGLIILEMLKISSIATLPLCFTFLTFFLSRGGSFRALMMREAAVGTTLIAACLFWIVKHTVIFSPFQSPVALAMSSPTFFGDRPRGPILGAREDVAPTSPPTHLRNTFLTSVGSNLGGILTDLSQELWMKTDKKVRRYAS
uniref:Uncharacterized protein n=1 Tax=Cacopsylla melanoneura TaxID=428564 RepID=A0A8D8SRP2_9HEMI